MTMEFELDDDVFFADISKQISLLIMDEDEQFKPASLSSSSSSLSFQELFRGGHQTAPYVYNQEQSKGTGVFIPKASQNRRRHHHQKQGRFNTFNAKQQQHSLHQNRQEYQHNHENSRSTLTSHSNNRSSMNSGVNVSVPRRTYRDPTSIYT